MIKKNLRNEKFLLIFEARKMFGNGKESIDTNNCELL